MTLSYCKDARKFMVRDGVLTYPIKQYQALKIAANGRVSLFDIRDGARIKFTRKQMEMAGVRA